MFWGKAAHSDCLLFAIVNKQRQYSRTQKWVTHWSQRDLLLLTNSINWCTVWQEVCRAAHSQTDSCVSHTVWERATGPCSAQRSFIIDWLNWIWRNACGWVLTQALSVTPAQEPDGLPLQGTQYWDQSITNTLHNRVLLICVLLCKIILNGFRLFNVVVRESTQSLC